MKPKKLANAAHPKLSTLQLSAHLLAVKSNAVTLKDIGTLFAANGIEGDVFDLFDDVDAWRRLALRLAIDARRIKRPYAIPTKRGRRRERATVEREAMLWLMVESTGNASRAARWLAKVWKGTPDQSSVEWLRQKYQQLKRDGLPRDTARMVEATRRALGE